jgi:hypothetical protein
MGKVALWLLIPLVAGGCRTPQLAVAPSTAAAPQQPTAQPAAQAPLPPAITGWFCPMHPNHTSHEAGNCPICGMALVAGDPFETRDYLLDFQTEPAVVRSGVPVRMVFRVHHPVSLAPITDYELVHDKKYHLFVISHDLEFFEHLHPDLQPDGSWQLELTLPKPGYYRVLSDFLPSRGSPQFLGRTLVTSDFEGDLESDSGQIEPDSVFRKTVDTITASVQLDPQTLVAGEYGHLRFTLTDARTGQPITDLQPYLGAFGHTLILSEDMANYVHSHPSEGPESDISRGLGGPNVSFEGYMPRAGRYRSWTQFLRNDRLTTISFTFSVSSLDDAMRSPR